jgi:hypothetical protein
MEIAMVYNEQIIQIHVWGKKNTIYDNASDDNIKDFIAVSLNKINESFESYKKHRHLVVERVVDYMENYQKYLPRLNTQTDILTENFFSCNQLLKMLK